ncbi:MAG: ISKra4 family transposase [Deltaproteobacteria bacterium]|nr:ISKra4 family transposase [Deltaproteobacteria bacterium]
MSLRARGLDWPRSKLVAYSRGRREDADPSHPVDRCGEDARASRRASSVSEARPGVGRDERATLRCLAGRPRGWLRQGGCQKGGLKAVLDSEAIAEIEALVGPGSVDRLDFEAIETAARRNVLHVAARAVERRLNGDESDHGGPTLPCRRCGGPARYAGRFGKTFTTVLGDMTLARAYYHCAACEAGFYPRDLALGLHDASLSPAVTRMAGLTAAMVSFKESDELLTELAGVTIGAKQVERTAEALGREIAEDERSDVEPEPPSAPTMYMGLDGSGIPMRAAELVGLEGKQADGTAKTKEVKLVTLWTAEGRDEEGIPVRDEGSVSYSAAIESVATRDTDKTPSAFAQRVEREACRRGFDQAVRRAIVADGAKWIWNLADEDYPDAIQILDLFHAKGHLWDVAKAIYGAGSALGEQWAKRRRDELDEGDVDAILDALRVHADGNDEARKCVDYVTTNRHRMRYPEFRAMGLCVSSGVVEAGCKVAIGTRLKRAGMHWTVAGANAIIALRCCKLSGRFEDFWERRSRASR